MHEDELPPGLLGRVLAEVKSIQATALDEETAVWFRAQSIADAAGLPLAQVMTALAMLASRGEVVMALTMLEGSMATVVYALAEAVENNNTRPEAG